MNHRFPSLFPLLSSLLYYWRINLAVALAVAILVAILTGALIVGDSMRGSLRDLTLDRLGRVENVLLSRHFFHEDAVRNHAPGIVLSGSATNASSKFRASKVNIYAIDQRFAAFFPESYGLNASLQQHTQIFPPIAINESLQRELHAKIGDALLLSFSKQSDIHRETVLGSRDPSDVVQTIRLTITKILPDRGIGRFGIRPHQSLPLNAYISYPVLQNLLRQESKINAIFMDRNDSQLLTRLQLQDLGIVLRDYGKFVSVESSEIILNPELVGKVENLANEQKLPYQRILTYLANTISANGRTIPYSTVTALESTDLPSLKSEEIALNEWAAEDLQAKVGDNVSLSYYTIGAGEQLKTASSSFRLKAIVKMEGIAGDPNLTPNFPGIHDVEHISEWSPPFPIDLKLIRPKDEDYWNRYRATPKAFVSERAGVQLWSSRFGSFTSIRVFTNDKEQFATALRQQLDPAQMGFAVTAVREQGLNSAAGATDFGMLFIGFSFFLMISAALLVGLLFRLSIEQRESELGLLIATGHPKRSTAIRFLSESIAIATTAIVPGVILAIGYAFLMIFGLRTWWNAAVGSTFLFLHVNILSVAIGVIVSLLIAVLTIAWSVRSMTRLNPITLLGGASTWIDRRPPTRVLPVVSILFLIFAGAQLLYSFQQNASPVLFFGAGVCLLISGLAFFSYWLKTSHRSFTSFKGMAARNSSRAPGRSILSTALVACACFIIVTVAANRQLPQSEGTGGFSLVAETDVPLHQNLNNPESRLELGVTDSGLLDQSRIYGFRLLPGDDVSCLNLYQPHRPRILGVPNEFMQQKHFPFQQKHASWNLLRKKIADDVVPVIGDANSVRWILHRNIGEDFVIQNEIGKPIRLRFVALLQSSIFQSELLISEENFLKHFPGSSGYSYFLIGTQDAAATKVAEVLENSLDDYGFDVTSTREKLAGYLAVENTYLSTFQTLGGLGLLLGTLGLSIVLIRNVLERRGELAMLRAVGFRRSMLTWMVLAENAFLLMMGILIGSSSALISFVPHYIQQSTGLPWGSLGVMLTLIIAAGMCAAIFAVRAALRIPLLPALKAE